MSICPQDKIILDPATYEKICLVDGSVIGDRIVEWVPGERILSNTALHSDVGSTVSRRHPILKAKIDRATLNTREYRLFRKMHLIADAIGAPTRVRLEAARVIREVLSRTKGYGYKYLPLASVAFAYRSLGLSYRDISHIMNIDERKLARYIHVVSSILGVKAKLDIHGEIARVVSKLSLPTGVDAEKIVQRALEIYRLVRPVTGMSPRVLICSCLAYAMKEHGVNVTKADISRAAGVSSTPVSRGVRLIARVIAGEIPGTLKYLH